MVDAIDSNQKTSFDPQINQAASKAVINNEEAKESPAEKAKEAQSQPKVTTVSEPKTNTTEFVA